MQLSPYLDSNAPRPSYRICQIFLNLVLLAALCFLNQTKLYAQAVIPPAFQQFQIQTDQSSLRILVGRQGLLARMGHNHVIVSRSMTGTVRLDTRTNQADAHLLIPVDDLIVDDVTDRQRAGRGYESLPEEKARAGTRANMQRPEVLDAAHYPEIRIDIAQTGYDATRKMIAITLMFKGSQIPLQLPATISIAGNHIQADASFSLDHNDLGLRPFSALGGALRVAETIQFELHIEASSSL